MAVEEVRVTGVDVAGFHGNKVLDELVGRLHGLLEEGDDSLVKLLLQSRISSEKRLVQELT